PRATRHIAITKGVDDDIRQRRDRQEDDAEQRQNPAAAECAIHQRGGCPEDDQTHAGKERQETTHNDTSRNVWRGLPGGTRCSPPARTGATATPRRYQTTLSLGHAAKLEEPPGN